MKIVLRSVAVVLFGVSSLALAQSATLPATDELTERASTAVQRMRFSDADKTEYVTRLTADYLRQIKAVLDQRAATLKALGDADAKTPEVNDQTTAAWRVARQSLTALRDTYVARISGVMTPFQVERVKDGLTDDWLPKVAQIYDEMIPDLTHPQRAHLLGLLTEMRENAMLELDAGPQEQWVHKYRGIINNYIARQSHDFSKLAKEYDAKRAPKK